MARTPFKLKSGNAPLKQSKFGGKKINLGKGISNFFSSLGRTVKPVTEFVKDESGFAAGAVQDLATTDVPREIAKDVRKTAKKYLGKEAVKTRKAKQRTKNVGTKYEGMTSFEKRMAKRKEARKPKR